MRIECRVCGGFDFTSLVNLPDFPLLNWPTKLKIDAGRTIDLRALSCDKCGHLQSSLEDTEIINSLYEIEYLNLPDNPHYFSRALRLRKILDLDGKSILDIGGGTNLQRRYFPDSIYGVLDIIEPAELADGNFDFYNQPIEAGDVNLLKFDVIFMFHILEHLVSPFEILNRIYEESSDDLILVIEVPNIQYYLKEMPNYLFITQHLSNFGLTQLDHLLQRAGFVRTFLLDQDTVILACFKKVKKRISTDTVFEQDRNRDLRKSVSRALARLENCQIKLMEKISKSSETSLAFLGIGGNTVTFLYFACNFGSLIGNFFDNDHRKEGFFVPGYSDKQIALPDLNSKSNVEYFTLNASIYRDYNEKIKITDISRLVRSQSD